MQRLLERLPRPLIIQGGMGVSVSLSGLASAVSNEGGIGVISAAGVGFENRARSNFFAENEKALISEIRKTKKMTDGIFGVNIMYALGNFKQLVLACVREKVPIIFVGAGVSLEVGKLLLGSETKLGVIVSSARALEVICRKYLPDIVVVEGEEAGGHIGVPREEFGNPAFSLENLVKEVLIVTKKFEKIKKIFVFAAGGIYFGADAKKFISLGADGVQIATRLVPTKECDVADEFKRAYVRARKEDIIIIDSPLHLPGRAIQNNFLLEVADGKWKPGWCEWNCIKTCDVVNSAYCIVKHLNNAAHGNLEEGFVFAGANAWRTTGIGTVHGVLSSFREEYWFA